jgi:FtsH-like protein
MEPEARKRQIMIWYSIVAVIGVLLVQNLLSRYAEVETLPYSTFERLLAEGHVSEVTVGADSIEGVLIGIGGRLATPPLPHHQAYGSVPWRFESLANTHRTRTGGRAI